VGSVFGPVRFLEGLLGDGSKVNAFLIKQAITLTLLIKERKILREPSDKMLIE
jgi:hypothetical protein